MTLAREAQAREDFVTAKNLLSSIVAITKSQAPDRPVDTDNPAATRPGYLQEQATNSGRSAARRLRDPGRTRTGHDE